MMESLQTPKIETVHQGQCLKVLRVTGEAGMHMPTHHSTQEAVLICQNGSAVLNMDGKDQLITKGQSLVIPGGAVHSLSLNAGFLALVIMDTKSTIIFEKN